jgi:hypothetical protein
MKTLNLLFGLSLIACIGLIECKNHKESDSTKVDPVFTEIVLKVGSHQVTRYEFEKQYKIFQSMYRQQHHTTPDSNAIRSWIDEFKDKQYFLADAYAKGYDKDKFVVNRTESMVRFIISQPKGLLDQELLAGLQNDNFTVQDKQKALRAKEEDEKKILTQHNNEIIKSSSRKINGANLYNLANIIKPYKDLHHFDKENFRSVLNANLLSYQINGNDKTINVSAFMDYYNALPAKYPIEGVETIRYYLDGMVIDDYDYQEAEKLGITKKLQFLLDKKNYVNSLISNRYEKFELTYDTVITAKELQTLYAKQKGKYVVPEKVVASVYYFDNRRDAFNTLVAFSRKNDTTPVQPLNFTSEQKHITITANTAIPDTIKNALYNLSIGKPSRPITLSKGYAVAIKEKEAGKRLKTVQELTPLFTQQIRNLRLNIRRKQILMSLKNKYKLQDHINYSKYL